MYRCIDAGWDPSPGPRVSPPRPLGTVPAPCPCPPFLRKKRSKGPKKKKKAKKNHPPKMLLLRNMLITVYQNGTSICAKMTTSN